MKLILLAIAFLLLPLVCYSQQTSEQQVLVLSKKKFEWMIHKHLDSLKNVLDDNLRYVHSNGWVETKQEVLDDITSGKLNYTSVDIHLAQARIYGQTAIITGTGKFQVTMNGTVITIELGYTEVYIQQKGRWLLVSRHANRMP
jgi:Domain of unknown function (DUF4440)